MAFRAESKTTYEATRVIQPIYTGGSVCLSQDGTILATSLRDEVLLTNLSTGGELCRISGDGEPITALNLTPDASWLTVSSRSLAMRIYMLQSSGDIIESKLARTLKPHSTPVVASACDATSSLLATGGANGEIKVWDLRGGYTTHTFHGHSGVVSALNFFQVDVTLNAVNGIDTRRKLSQRKSMTEASNEATVGFRLASGGADGKIRIWDLYKRKSIAILDSHASIVTSLDYCDASSCLLSASRDRTAVLWDIQTHHPQATIAVLEGVENAGFLKGGTMLYTGGENGRLRIWSTDSGNEITEDQTPGTETEAIVGVLYHPDLHFVVTVHADQTILLHDLDVLDITRIKSTQDRIHPLPVFRRISGTHDEVIDLAYVGLKRDVLALATNLEEVRLISLRHSSDTDGSYFGADIATLKGHHDVIITIDSDWSGLWLATGGKDNLAKLWRLDPENDSYTCYATFTGHAESISAVALPNSVPVLGSKEYNHPLDYPPRYLVTGSQDNTVKKWDIPSGSGMIARAKYTRKAHDKDINAIETSYSGIGSLFASASQDRTVKIWDADAGEAIGVLRGHKRGVWSVAFSPLGVPALSTGESGGASTSKGMIVTGSGDKSVKIWSLADFTCLRTFEGHTNSVLKVIWLPSAVDERANRASSGPQVASAAGDGLVKVWDAQSSECAATLDNHIDRVWALAVKPEPVLTAEQQNNRASKDIEMDGIQGSSARRGQTSIELVSGSADSTLTFWTDTTASTAQAATTQATARIEQDQELQNHIRSRNYREAIVLALQLNHPKRLLDLFTSVVNGPQEPGSFTGQHAVDTVLAELIDSQLWTLLRRLRDWNANGRTHNVAQHVLHAILRLHSKERLLSLQKRRNTKSENTQASDTNGLADAMATLTTERDEARESIKDLLDGLKAYTERHYTRLQQTSSERYVLAWALQQMGEGVDDGGSHGLTNGENHGLLENGTNGMILS